MAVGSFTWLENFQWKREEGEGEKGGERERERESESERGKDHKRD
jgi:hypothetical protein